MNGLAVALVLLSTVFHAAWNLLARSQRSEHTFLLRALWGVLGVGLVPVGIGLLLRPLPGTAFWCVLISGPFCGIYYLGLARAYSSGDFTVVYPIARALPVLAVGLGDIARGRFPSAGGWIGMMLVAAACTLIPLHSLRQFSARHYVNRNMGWVILAAVGTTGYTLADKFGAEAIHAVRAGLVSAMLYSYLFFAVSALTFLMLLRIFGRPQEDSEAVGWKRPLLAGLLTFGSYSLVVWAYQLTSRAGYVVAFRQFSIVIGVVLASVWFSERGAALRIAAACIMVLGLALIGVFG